MFGVFQPLDILALINAIEADGAQVSLPTDVTAAEVTAFLDVNGDGSFFANDILFAINEFNIPGFSQGQGEGEAEGEGFAFLEEDDYDLLPSLINDDDLDLLASSMVV